MLFSTLKTVGLSAALVLASSMANAASITLKRGVSMELWNSWPAESEWSKPEVLFPFPEWRRTVTPEALKQLKADGLDFVRLPIDPGVFTSPQTTDLREKLFAEIEATLNMFQAAGLNVVLDLHTIPAGADRPSSIETVLASGESFAAYTKLAVTFAKRFATTPNTVLELINEPVIDCEEGEAKRWPAMMGSLHKAARQAAPDLPMLITGGCWGDASMLADLPKSVINDGNNLFSFHSYAPFLLTHQGATWAGDFIRYVTGLPFPPDRFGKNDLEFALNAIEEKIRNEAPATRVNGMISYLREEIALIDTPEELKTVMQKPFNIAAKFADENNISRERLLLGEFGMIRQEYDNPAIIPAESRVLYIRQMLQLAESSGFGWSIWGYSGAFGIVQGFSGEALDDAIISRALSD